MKVVFLSDQLWEGGAAQATSRIAGSLFWNEIKRRRSCSEENDRSLWTEDALAIDSIIFFQDTCTNREYPSRSITPLWYEESPAKRRWLRLPRKLLPGFFPHPHTPAFAAQRLRRVLKKACPDIINVHNLHAASPWGWGPHLIEICLEFAPVVWTLHDMWSFTGRCAYSYDCEKFITGCDAACPTPHEQPKLLPEQIRCAWEDRQVRYDRHRKDLVLVTPSRWLAEQARRGLFAQHRIEIIPYSLPWISSFKPTPRESARRDLGIDSEGPLLLIAAHDLTERRKGAEILRAIWQHIPHRPLTLLTMGHGSIEVDDPKIKVHALGWIGGEVKKAVAYSAADALLHPAPVDNFPNVVLEAFACGTPVIAMPIGGLREMVRPGISGWLADAASPIELGRAVARAFTDLGLHIDLRESCRTLVEKEYASEEQGHRYLKLFKELIRR